MLCRLCRQTLLSLEAGCVGTSIIFFFMSRIPHDLENQLKIHKDFCSNMCMIVNIDKTKFMIIKSNKITYGIFVYDNNNLDEVKYLGINIITLRKWLLGDENLIMGLKTIVNQPIFGYGIRRIIGWWKAYYGLENNCKSTKLWLWDNEKTHLWDSRHSCYLIWMWSLGM